jgi:NADPH-dependent 2,4-dienoyl-CoA reductase/sulfur reductase-like enzyme/nitrite reductase/ring-hydroxylating ferredoxin subunit
MSQAEGPAPGPDFTAGVPLVSIPPGGVLAGRVGDEAVLLARLDDGSVHAVAAHCTHYGGPLAEGLVEGDEIRCPWHHACFSLRTGRARHAPAFAPLAKWRVDTVGDTVFVRGRDTTPPPARTRPDADPRRIVIVGGGAAGYAAALRLRELGHDGSITMLSADDAPPCDRPNLSKDYLAGTAPEDWIPLQPRGFYADRGIDLHLGCKVARIDTKAREATTLAGDAFGYDALLLATGAEPRRLNIPGADLPNVFTLRTLADARAIIAAALRAKSVAFVGAGFIGLEAAAALRMRGLDVHVVAPETVPMERVLGRELGDLFADLHRRNGVSLHLGATPASFDGHVLGLDNGTRLLADLLVVGTGVTPRTALASAAGLQVDIGIVVDSRLQTSVAGHYAAGDVARYPHAGELVRVEHWVHAQRQGQAVAANMLGADRAFADVPFFWTHQYDLELRYTGQGAWDDMRIDGSLAACDFTARYFRGGRLVAAASCGRDLENLQVEAQLAGQESGR